jgi:hypothetical protein
VESGECRWCVCVSGCCNSRWSLLLLLVVVGSIVLTVGTPTDWTDNTISVEVCGERSKIGCGRSAGGL